MENQNNETELVESRIVTHRPTFVGNGNHKKAIKTNVVLRQMLIEEGMKPVTASGMGFDMNDRDFVETRLQRVVERIYDEAELGQAWAVNLLFDRIEGKAGQATSNNEESTVLVLNGVSMDEL